MGTFVDKTDTITVPLPPVGITDGDFVSGAVVGGDRVNPSAPWSMVSSRFDQSMATAETMLDKLIGGNGETGYLNELQNIITEISVTDVAYNSVTVADVSAVTTTMPIVGTIEFPAFSLDIDTVPTAPDIASVPIASSLIDGLSTPVLQNNVTDVALRDSIVAPSVADSLIAPTTENALVVPTLRTDTMSVTLPKVPTFTGTVETDFGTFDIESPSILPVPAIDMSGLMTADMPEDLTAAILWFEESYDNSIYTPLFNRLITDLQSGASGIGGTVEQEIYDRAQARQNIEEDKQQAEIEEYFSSTGFDLPTGAMAARLQEHANGRAMRSLDLNGKIIIEQADLAQKNSQFVIEAARNLEAVLRDYATKKNDRALDYSKAVAANAIAIYAEGVKGFVAQLEANKTYVQLQAENLRAVIEANKGAVAVYAAEAQAYEISVNAKAKKNEAITEVFKAEMYGYSTEAGAITEVFKTEIQEQGAYNSAITEKYKAEVQEQDSVNSTAAEIYKAKVQGQAATNQAAVDIYKSKVQEQDSINSAATEIFKAQVQKQTSINNAETELFKAKIQEQDSINSSKTELFKAKVGLFSAEVSADVDTFRAKVEAYSAESSANTEKYKADIAGNESYNRTIVDTFKAEVAGYDSETRAISENQKNILQVYALKIQDAENQLKAATASAENAVKSWGTEYSLRERVAESMANVAMQSMASAYGAVNSSAGLSYSAGESLSESWSHSENRGETWSHSESIGATVSLGNSLSESHEYKE